MWYILHITYYWETHELNSTLLRNSDEHSQQQWTLSTYDTSSSTHFTCTATKSRNVWHLPKNSGCGFHKCTYVCHTDCFQNVSSNIWCPQSNLQWSIISPANVPATHMDEFETSMHCVKLRHIKTIIEPTFMRIYISPFPESLGEMKFLHRMWQSIFFFKFWIQESKIICA